MKFVSISTLYGGARAVLCARNKDDAIWGLSSKNCVRKDAIIKIQNLQAPSS